MILLRYYHDDDSSYPKWPPSATTGSKGARQTRTTWRKAWAKSVQGEGAHRAVAGEAEAKDRDLDLKSELKSAEDETTPVGRPGTQGRGEQQSRSSKQTTCGSPAAE